MKTVTYFRASLLVPCLVPLILMPFGNSFAVTILYLSLAFGGIQYACFAFILFLLLGKIHSTSTIRHLATFAPILFIPFQYGGWIVFSLIKYDKVGNSWEILPMAFYSIILGYAYVSFVLIAYGALKSKGWVNDDEDF